MMEARKKGAIVRYVDGEKVMVMPRQKKRATLSALGSTQGRMANARVAMLKANLRNAAIKPTNRTTHARVELLKKMMHMDAIMAKTPRVDPRVKLLRQMLKTQARRVA